MNDEQLSTLAQLGAFVEGTVAMDFTVAEERYEFIARTVKRFGYGRLKRRDKAVVLRFLERVSGYSRQHHAPLHPARTLRLAEAENCSCRRIVGRCAPDNDEAQ